MNRQLIERVSGGMQVAVREMQIDGGVFQVRMPAKWTVSRHDFPGLRDFD